MSPAENYIRKKLDEKLTVGTYRSLKQESGLIDFCSNDYLGFARSAVIKDATLLEIEQHPQMLNGSTGSRLLSGNMNYTEKLEQEIAAYFKSDAGLLFNSGYDANVGLFSALPQKGDTIIHDEFIHASVIDGARLSHANRYIFRHNDPDSLEAKLKQAKGICFVVIESVYSMNGDIPPINDILKLTQAYGAHLIVDEAHAVGLHPAGLVVQLNLQEGVFARIVTFGKAMGCHGAIVLGGDLLRQYLINFSRPFIYTTAAPFHQLATIKAALAQLRNARNEAGRLRENISLFKNGVKPHIIHPLLQSDSPIQCIMLNSATKAKEAAIYLQNSGFDVRAILSPTVPEGTERIRICLHAFNTLHDTGRLTAAINLFVNA